MEVTPDPAAIRAGRRYVEAEVLARGAAAVREEAALVAAELLANAAQHGAPPISLNVSGDEHLIRVEVRDGSPRAPVRTIGSTTNMTGRGLALVEAVAARWGVRRVPGDGKVVWAEFETSVRRRFEGAASNADAELDALEASRHDGDGQRYTVVLGDVPTGLLLEAKAHVDNLVRELTLAASAPASELAAMPPHLAGLVQTVVHGFADARDAIKRQALAAARRGEQRTCLTLHLHAVAAEAGEAYLTALDEADGYARAARLLTLETPPAHRLFRRWYVGAVVRQLRDLAAGRSPEPVQTFESRMLSEIERLASLQRVTDRAARLQRVTAALARARTSEDVATVVVSEGVAALDASGGGLLVPSDDGVHVAVPGAVGYGEELVGALREERLDAPLPAATALRTGRPVWLESPEERNREFPALRGFEAATVSMCAVPLVVAGRTLGALRFSFTVRRLFDDDERAFVLALAAQTAQTLLRTETYAAERQASLALQRALLPAHTPTISGWSIAAYYSPAGQQEAGGDFYDVLDLGAGAFVAFVGDVMGRGLEAAAAMTQVRTMMRAYAIDDPTPELVLARIDRFFRVADLSQFVTAIYLLVDADSGVVTLVNAGHLPPVVVTSSDARLVEVPAGTPLGIDGGARQPTTVRLAPGDAMIAITDGLVERRTEDIDVGIERLLAGIKESAARADAGELLRVAVAAAAPGDRQDDDVTVLVLRRL